MYIRNLRTKYTNVPINSGLKHLDERITYEYFIGFNNLRTKLKSVLIQLPN